MAKYAEISLRSLRNLWLAFGCLAVRNPASTYFQFEFSIAIAQIVASKAANPITIPSNQRKACRKSFPVGGSGRGCSTGILRLRGKYTWARAPMPPKRRHIDLEVDATRLRV